MTVLVVFTFTLAIAAVLVMIAGNRLPRDHTAAVRGIYAAAPDAVWRLISNPAQSASWRHDVKRVDMLPTENGRLVWKEVTGRGVTTYEMVSQVPMVSQVSRNYRRKASIWRSVGVSPDSTRDRD